MPWATTCFATTALKGPESQLSTVCNVRRKVFQQPVSQMKKNEADEQKLTSLNLYPRQTVLTLHSRNGGLLFLMITSTRTTKLSQKSREHGGKAFENPRRAS